MAFFSIPVEQKDCTQKTGPSAAQWVEHKTTIIRLYKDHPLKYVMGVMAQEYGFHANKRMYDRRLRLWGASKTLKASEKQKIVDMLVQSGAWTNENSPSQAGHADVGDDDYSKVVRFARSRSQRKSQSLSPNEVQTPGQPAEVKWWDYLGGKASPSGSGSWVVVSSQSCPTAEKSDENSSDEEVDAATTMDVTLSSPSTQSARSSIRHRGSQCSPSSPDFGPINVPSSTSIVVSHKSLSASSEQHGVVGPQLLIPQNNQSLNPQRLFKSLNVYMNHIIQNQSFTDNYSIGGTAVKALSPTSEFWSEVKNGIYLLKIQLPKLAWPALQNAGQLANAALEQPTSLDLGFLKELFLTLSPINTKTCPLVRTHLLQLLRYLVCAKLNSEHPLTTIFSELQRDENDREVSERALASMINVVYHNFGILDPTGRAFEFQCSTVTLLRRSGDLTVAAAEAKTLMQRCRTQLSIFQIQDVQEESVAKLIYSQSRRAAVELAHVRMDQRGNHYDEALTMSLYALTGRQDVLELESDAFESWPPAPEDVLSNEWLYDKKTIYVMEDLAKIYWELGLHELAITWLESARIIAEDVLGKSEANTSTAHIADKLDKMKSLCRN